MVSRVGIENFYKNTIYRYLIDLIYTLSYTEIIVNRKISKDFSLPFKFWRL